MMTLIVNEIRKEKKKYLAHNRDNGVGKITLFPCEIMKT